CPYGKWTCADGREVIFNRSYSPILERRPGEGAKPANPGEWVESIVADESFWEDIDGPRTNPGALDRVNAILADWGFPPLPVSPPRFESIPSAEIIPFRATPFKLKAPRTLPPRVNPWLHPFGAAPEPTVERSEPEEAEADVKVEVKKTETAPPA